MAPKLLEDCLAEEARARAENRPPHRLTATLREMLEVRDYYCQSWDDRVSFGMIDSGYRSGSINGVSLQCIPMPEDEALIDAIEGDAP